MFRHDLEHTGYTTSEGPKTNNLLWSHHTGGSVDSSPAVSGGHIYVGSWDNNVYCLNANTGAKVWNYSAEGVYSSPAIANGKVYFGSVDGNVYCLNALTGVKVWSYNTRSMPYSTVESSPAVVNGKVYICNTGGSSWGDNVFCLNANTGAKVWGRAVGLGSQSSPAVSGGYVYFGSNDGNVYCLNANTGATKWSHYVKANYIRSSPAIANGKLYIGTIIDSVQGNNYGGYLYCLDANTGAHVWNYSTVTPCLSSPAIANGKVYTSNNAFGGDNVFCLNANTGSKIWSYSTGYPVFSSPAVSGGYVYFGSDDKNVYCLNANTGAKVWNYMTGGRVGSSPAISGGYIYIGSEDGNVYAFGPAGVLTVTSPNGGESWVRSTTHVITWTSSGAPGANIKIELLKGGAVNTVISSSTPNDGSYSWAIPAAQAAGTDYKIRITSTTNTAITDSSNSNFAITIGSLTVTSPNGGEQWVRGNTHTITWASAGSPGSYVKIELLKGATVNTVISANTANDGSFSWVIPAAQALGKDYKIRITSTTNTAITDSSNANFAIVIGSLTVTSPNGGESWVRGTTHTITWSSSGTPGASVKIELLKAGAVNTVISASTANDGSYSWTIPVAQTLGTDYRIRITSSSNTAITDSSNANFAITIGALTVTSPNGGEQWVRGTTHTITWTSLGAPGANVKIELLKAGVVSKVIVASTPNDGSYSWTIPSTQTLGTDYRIRITSTSYTAITDSSNTNFTIKSG